MDAIQKKTHTIPVPLTDLQHAGLCKLKSETGLSLAAIIRLATKDYLLKK